MTRCKLALASAILAWSHGPTLLRIPDEADQRSGMMSITIPG